MSDDKQLPEPTDNNAASSEGADNQLARLAESSRQIAQMREDWRHDHDFLDGQHLIYPEMRDKSVLDEYRNLRTRLLQRSEGRNAVTMVSGIGVGAGASLVAANLAIAFALDSAKTALLVDCHLKDPRLGKLLNVESGSGLTDYLMDEELGVEAILYQTGIPRLRMIPVGSHFESGQEFFTSFRMKAFLKALKDRYPDRFLIFSVPPLDDSADSRILADLCDLAMLVAPYGRVTESRLLEAANVVGKEKLAGVVLNRVPPSPFGRSG